jgi:hypothetical protein
VGVVSPLPREVAGAVVVSTPVVVVIVAAVVVVPVGVDDVVPVDAGLVVAPIAAGGTAGEPGGMWRYL